MMIVRVALRVLAGQAEAAKSAGEEARPLLETRLREQPDDILAMMELSWVYLALGRNADALRLSRQAADSLSIEKDAMAGPFSRSGSRKSRRGPAHLRKPLKGFDIYSLFRLAK